MYKVIVAVSEYTTRKAIRSFLESGKYSVVEAQNSALSIEYFKAHLPDAVILDIKMQDVGGLVVLRKIKELNCETPVLLLADHNEIDIAVRGLDDGAYDYFPKPPDKERLLFVLTRCIKSNKIIQKARHAVNSMLRFHLGQGQAMKRIIDDIEMIADTNGAINVLGESGTGKSLIARLIHHSNSCPRGPFIAIDAEAALKGDIPAGVEKLFQRAAGGTIYFRGLQNISAALQANLVAAIAHAADNESSEDVRIIASFPINLRHLKDPFLFLDWFVIDIPPLCRRIEDIPFLAGKFLTETADELNVAVRAITKDALRYLSQYRWPGNVRELKSAIRRVMLTTECSLIRAEHFYFLYSDTAVQPSISLKDEKERAVRDIERTAILKALDMTSGHRTATAQLLGISRKTLWEKLKEYNVTE
ncbi:MAG: sigma-54-dependent Fis family transcriptional regulator [Nitrospirae bacterium]|nr:sigma-54-dependent Fis family transcriptional regulator [Nitrospirota bacterium]